MDPRHPLGEPLPVYLVVPVSLILVISPASANSWTHVLITSRSIPESFSL